MQFYKENLSAFNKFGYILEQPQKLEIQVGDMSTEI